MFTSILIMGVIGNLCGSNRPLRCPEALGRVEVSLCSRMELCSEVSDLANPEDFHEGIDSASTLGM